MRNIFVTTLAMCLLAGSSYGESAGPLIFDLPPGDGWGLQLHEKMPNDGEVRVWTNGSATKQISYVAAPLPVGSKSIDDFFPGWKRGFEKKAKTIIDSRIVDIHGTKFGYSEITASVSDKNAAIKQYCVIWKGRVYSIGITVLGPDAGADTAYQKFGHSIELKTND